MRSEVGEIRGHEKTHIDVITNLRLGRTTLFRDFPIGTPFRVHGVALHCVNGINIDVEFAIVVLFLGI